MKVLVINTGSSSLKSQLIEHEGGKVIAKITAERVGTEKTIISFKSTNGTRQQKQAANHEQAIQIALEMLCDKEIGIIKNLDEIDVIGHRVVHGGEYYKEPVLIKEDVIQNIRSCNALAPLHNPACILGIKACEKFMPNTPQVAVFDTAFHQTIKEGRYLYPIPLEAYQQYGIRKYGFHGISHQFLTQSLTEIIGKIPEKAILFHLGQGASLCAVENGESVDTTMGISPLAGVIMGTRSGDIDPSIVGYLASMKNIPCDEVIDLLNKESGMLALSGVSSDFRDILEAADTGNKQAQMALEKYYENVAQYAAKFMITLNGAKYFVFAGGIGENCPKVRTEICKKLQIFGVDLDEEKNAQAVRKSMKISSKESKIEIYVIPTNEELMIAKQSINQISK